MGHFSLSLSLSQTATALSLITDFEGQGTKNREVLPDRIRIKLLCVPRVVEDAMGSRESACIVCRVREAQTA